MQNHILLVTSHVAGDRHRVPAADRAHRAVCLPRQHRPAFSPAESKNAYIWAAWAYLEGKQGDVKTARTLYDAATVADSEHAAAWHGWGLLEKRQGNIVRARDLWMRVRRLPPPLSLGHE